jgi:hypothetical protein
MILIYTEIAVLLQYVQISDKAFGSIIFTIYVVCVLDTTTFMLLVLVIQQKET